MLAAVSMTVATALFAALIDGRFGARAARVGALWFAFGAGIALLSSRVPFDLGLALGLAALVLAPRARWAGGARRSRRLTALASPVAARLPGARRRRVGARRDRAGDPALAGGAGCCALAPVALLTLAFPEGGTQPFVASAFYPALAAVVAIGLRSRPSSACCASAPRCTRCADRRLRGAERGRRQRRPPRRARRRPARGVRAARRRAARAPLGRCSRSPPLCLLAGERAGHRLRLDAVEPRREGVLLRSRCWPSCARSASATGRPARETYFLRIMSKIFKLCPGVSWSNFKPYFGKDSRGGSTEFF